MNAVTELSEVGQYPTASRYVDFDIDPAFDVDPYTPLLEVSKRAPVVAGRNGIFHGVRVPNNFLYPDKEQDVYLALSYDAVRQVAIGHETFSSERGYGNTLRIAFGKTLMSMDEPEHGRYKRLVLPSFSHRMVTDGLARIAQPIIDTCLDKIVDTGQGELVSQFTTIFPYQVVAKIFGVPPAMHAEAEQLVVDACKMGENPQKAIAALQSMNAIYQKVVDEHRLQPLDDLTQALMNTELDGGKLTDDEIVSFMKQIIAAGLDTTVRQTANLIYLLLENPEQFEELKQNRSLLENAIWESLRLLSAGGIIPRMATKDATICGVRIPAGSGVYGVQHIANLDETRYDQPLKFNLHRKRVPIMTFGAGVHACLGANLSIAEIKIAMVGVLDRLPNLRKDPKRWPGTVVRGFQLRSPTKLPVLWDPVR